VEPSVQARLVEEYDSTELEYNALSYAWGADGNTTTMECDGQLLNLTSHLLEGLKSIFAHTGVLSIWVDAICINQNDDAEKATQVAKMHNIYRHARCVFVWLGKEQDSSDVAMDAIMAASLINVPGLPENTDEALIAIVEHKSNAPILFEESAFVPVARLSERAWFYRLWIAQEYFYARDLIFYCGQKVLDGSAFTRVLRHLSINSFGPKQPLALHDEDLNNLFKGYLMFGDLRRIKSDETKPDLFQLVMQSRVRQVKEPIDRLYALFGITESTDMIYRKSIPIDYSPENRQEYWRTYAMFGKFALLHEPNLRLLSVVDSVDRPELLPSWCPNLNSTSSTESLGPNYTAGWTPVDSKKPLVCPNFKGKDGNHVTVSWSDDTIKIWGSRVGEIRAVNRKLVPSTDFDEDNLFTAKPFASDMLAWFDSCKNFCSDAMSGHKTAEFVWQEIMVATKNDPAKRAEAADMSPYNMTKTVLDLITRLRDDHSRREDIPDLYRIFDAVYTWCMVIQAQWENRYLFVTNDGKLGFAHTRIEEGDQVCKLYGGSLLYILRQQHDQVCQTEKFQFISEAYVFDHMDGEVFNLLETSLVKEEEFFIV